MHFVRVAIGIVVDEDRVLVCLRGGDDALAGYWEFPGGKLEPAESPEQCVVRELREEVNLTVAVTEPLDPFTHDYGPTRVQIHPFLCRPIAGHTEPRSARAVQWTRVADLPALRTLPANAALIRTLLARFAPPPSPPG